MKKLMMGLALAALATTPALANGSSARTSNAGYSAYDYASGPGYGAYDASFGSVPVFDNGKYLGADPDPFIRGQMRRGSSASIANGGN
jgi:hypothetical protein